MNERRYRIEPRFGNLWILPIRMRGLFFRAARVAACEEWCDTNRPVPEPVPLSLAVEEQEVPFFEEAWHK